MEEVEVDGPVEETMEGQMAMEELEKIQEEELTMEDIQGEWVEVWEEAIAIGEQWVEVWEEAMAIGEQWVVVVMEDIQAVWVEEGEEPMEQWVEAIQVVGLMVVDQRQGRWVEGE